MVLRRYCYCGAVLMVLLVCPGCARYEPRPLRPSEVVRDVERSRRLAEVKTQSNASLPPDSGVDAQKAPFTFVRAAELMKAYSPALKEVQAEYETALALAKIKTPLPNPSLEAGPNFGFGRDVTGHRVAPFGSIGFAIPLGGRLKRQDELNRIQAEKALVEMRVRSRELYLQLRQAYARLALSRAQLALRKTIAESAAQSLELSQKRVGVGEGTSLDVGLMRLEMVRAQTDVLATESSVIDSEGEISEVVGVSADYLGSLPATGLPTLPAALPTDEVLRELLVCNQPQLVRLRLAYEVAERELRLEIARQYPDFQFGPSYERETGEIKNTLGLTLGIELPVFNRNQQAIVTATKRREEIRAKYEAAANRALAQLERARRAVALLGQRMKLAQESLHPQARQNLELASKSIEVGTADTLRLLETERGERGVTLQLLETELSLREAWIVLEQIVGCPLLSLPGEAEEYPQLDQAPAINYVPEVEKPEDAPENNE